MIDDSKQKALDKEKQKKDLNEETE